MKKLVLSVAILSLAACGGEAEAPAEDSAPAEEEVADAPAAMDTIDLAGNWNLVSLNQNDIPGTLRMTISASGDTISVRSGCANMSWPYTMNGNIIDTGEGTGDKSGCAGDRSTWEYTVAKIVREANIVMNAGEGELQVSGPGGIMNISKAG